MDNSTGAVLRVTLTDRNGVYAFHDLSSTGASIRLKVLAAGVLTPASRASGNFLRAHKYDILGEDNIYGQSHALSNPLFTFLLDDTQTPIYNRVLADNSFEGTSWSVAHWSYLLSHIGEVDAVYASTLSAYQGMAQQLLSPCSASIHSADAFESNLAAASLNIVSGRGFFAPYKLLQSWYFSEAQYVFCSSIQDSATRSRALRFLQLINSATNIDSQV